MTVSIYRPREPGYALPGSPRHNAMITASKAAAICGVSRWSSAYSTWLEMQGRIDPEPPKDIFDTGKAMELALAELWKLRNPGWRLSPHEVQYQNDEYGFPAAATPDRVASRGSARRLVEFKIARDWEDWGDVSTAGDCPRDYAAQAAFQMGISGVRKPIDLLVMGPWFSEKLYTIEYDEVVWDWMLGCCRRFWDSLFNDEPPALDDSVSTYRAVRELHPDIEVGARAEIPESLALEYGRLQVDTKQIEGVLRGVKSEILAKIGSAQFATCNGDIIAARQPHAKGGIALVQKGVFEE
jgi:predicted phage-related endonuclease